MKSSSAVKVAALTGVAARLVYGLTLHTLFKLPVQKDGKITPMPLLTGNYLQIMRRQWQDVQFLFIDEVSMVPYEMLCMIDSRLKQLKGSTELFGGINILLFGDLMQLPPVRGSQVFHQPPSMTGATHLWRLFSLVELKENMRQKGDTTFIDILNSLRNGELNASQYNILLQKVMQSEADEDGEFALGKAIRIYPTNVLVDQHNARVLEYFRTKKNVQLFQIKAQDSIVDATRKMTNVELETIIPSDINKTGGFPASSQIFVGAKVMLRKNIDTMKGLVNGAIGTITEIVWPLYRRGQIYENDIPAVRIHFDGVNNETHLIEPHNVQFPAKFSYGTIERRMLPLILSWATTSHKMQGTTVDYAVIDLGHSVFAQGQAYVSLSRVKSLEGLKINNLKYEKLLLCNKAALNEMARMRALIL